MSISEYTSSFPIVPFHYNMLDIDDNGKSSFISSASYKFPIPNNTL